MTSSKNNAIKLTVIIASTLIFMFAVVGVTYFLCANHVSELSHEDFVSTDKYVSADNVFTGRFKCTEDGKNICKYEYVVRDERLYITIYATPGYINVLPVDHQGYVNIKIDPEVEFKDVRYISKDKETTLSFERVLN